MTPLPKISTQAIIEGVRSKKDGSLGLNVSTPELTPQEKALFMELQGQNLHIEITPTDQPEVMDYTIDAESHQKSPSQRMRAVLFILWNQGKKELDFATYYTKQMDAIIEKLKERIE